MNCVCRSPILRGETELALRQSPATDGERQRLENQLEEFDRLNALITQILTLARAEAGQIALAPDVGRSRPP